MSEFHPRKHESLKESLSKLKSDIDKAIGANEQFKQRLQKEFGCKTLKEAKQLTAELEEKLASLKKLYDKKLARLREEFPHVFQES